MRQDDCDLETGTGTKESLECFVHLPPCLNYPLKVYMYPSKVH